MLYLLYSIIALIILFVIISTIFRKRIYKEVDRLEEWKNSILNRGIPDEIGKVKELHMSGQTEEKFEAWRSEWDEIAGVTLPGLEEHLFDIEELASKNRFKKAKEAIMETQERLRQTEEHLEQMLADIDQLVNSAEKNRSEIDEVRIRHMNLQKVMLKKRGSLGAGLAAFDAKMERVGQLLALFDKETEDGSYLKARELLDETIDLLNEVESLVEEYPKLLVKIEVSIPSEIRQLKEGMQEMEQSGYQLEAFEIDGELAEMEKDLMNTLEEVKALQCENAEATLDKITKRLDKLYELLEHEVESKQVIGDQLEGCHDQLETVGLKLHELEQELQVVKQSYYVPEAESEKQKNLHADVIDLTMQLDVLHDVIENEKQTYTSIREMLAKWVERLETIDSEIEESRVTLNALREDEWQAEETLRSLKESMLEIHRTLNRSNLLGLPKRTLDHLELAEEKLIEAANQLDEVPLEIGRINVLIQEAVEMVEKNADLINEVIDVAEIAERVIQYGNRYRSMSNRVDSGLRKAEELFREFEYEEALKCAVEVLEEVEPDVLKRVEDMIAV